VAELERAREEAARLEEQVRTLRADADGLLAQAGELTSREGQGAEELPRLRDDLAVAQESVRHLEDRVREIEAAREALTQQLQAADNERAATRTELQRLHGEPAARMTEGAAEELAALRADRDDLAERVRGLRAEVDQLRANEEARLVKEMGRGAASPAKPALVAAEAQGTNGSQAEQTPERAALEKELAKLRQDNVQMRQWLARFGIQLG
jgi:chromosome segregation ATPase